MGAQIVVIVRDGPIGAWRVGIGGRATLERRTTGRVAGTGKLWMFRQKAGVRLQEIFRTRHFPNEVLIGEGYLGARLMCAYGDVCTILALPK